MKGYGNRYGLLTANGVAGTVGASPILTINEIITTGFDPNGDSSREITEVNTAVYTFVSVYAPVEEETATVYEDGTESATDTPFMVAIHLSGVEGANRQVFAQYVKLNSAGAITSAGGETLSTTIETTAIKTSLALVVATTLVSTITGKSVEVTIPAGKKFGFALVSA